jgi:uncharacterized zinc-type alcohol dehydrogenase-like protein
MPRRSSRTRPLARAYAAFSKTSRLGPYEFERRLPGPRDVQFDVLFCGVCHSDLHTARGEWSGTTYPCVPGHEIVGRVTRVGRSVTSFRVGDIAAVGCMVDSCKSCGSCREGLEQYCENDEVTWTYNTRDKRGPGPVTYGGYSSVMVVDERFCLHVPKNLDLAAAAPLLCAGITTYSPLRHWGAAKGTKVGIVGLGGLGHMGVKFSHAFGAETVVLTSSRSKKAQARRLGADEVVLTSDRAAMKKHKATFDIVLNTVSVSHDLDAYTTLLKRDGTLVLVGAPKDPHAPPSVSRLVAKRRRIAGSLIGGIAETQEMLDYCGKRGIVCDVEVIEAEQINDAYERMLRRDVTFRFVIDIASLSR